MNQMTREPTSRVVYLDSSKEVIVKREGIEIARYRSAEELVEVHIKGLMAIDTNTLSARQISDIYKDKSVDGGG